MKRPSFQFYPGDWQKNAKLRRCTPAARGVWLDILCLLHDAEEYGVLRWPLKDVINAVGASSGHVRELVDKGVLKGADRDAAAYVYRPKHAGKVGEPVILAIPDGGPLWYSSRMIRDEWVRGKRGATTRFDTADNPSSRSPTRRVGDGSGDGPSSSSSSSSSVAKATEAGASPADAEDPKTDPPSDPAPERRTDPRRDLWNAALDVLARGGCEVTATARAFMGKLVKDYTFEVVRDAVAVAVTEQPVEARAFLKATCIRLKGERKSGDPTAPHEVNLVRELNAASARDTKPTPEEAAARRQAAADIKARRALEALAPKAPETTE